MSISRRQFLATGAAAGAFGAPGLTATGALGQICRPPPISVRNLPIPNLNYRTASIIDKLAQVRPQSATGVRLEMLERGSGENRRFLIHNFGHGGGGITLSFGCARVVAGHVAEILKKFAPGARPSVAVIGTGIIGLTSAEAIKKSFPQLAVTIYSKDVELAKTCSWVAAGQFEPSGIWRNHRTPLAQRQLRTYLTGSLAYLEDLKRRGAAAQYGVIERANFSLADGISGMDNAIVRPFIKGPKCGTLPFRTLAVQGREYGTWLINPRILMPRLVRYLNENGVIRRRLAVEPSLGMDDTSRFFRAVREQIVINCTGIGSMSLVPNSGIVPIKGLVVLIRNPDPSRFNYFFSGANCDGDSTHPNYLFCRQNDIVLGGTWFIGSQHNNTTADEATADGVMRRLRRLFEGRTTACG